MMRLLGIWRNCELSGLKRGMDGGYWSRGNDEGVWIMLFRLGISSLMEIYSSLARSLSLGNEGRGMVECAHFIITHWRFSALP